MTPTRRKDSKPSRITMMKELSMSLGSIVELKIDFNFTGYRELGFFINS
jgi:hypothetical protein